MTNRIGTIAGLCLCGALAAWALSGCTPAGAPTDKTQRIIDVLCRGDAVAQPVIVPVVATVSPIAGTADELLVHPAVVRACAKYASKPAEIVPAVPPDAVVAAPVLVPVAP